MTGNGDLKVHDLPRSEQVKALLPATGAILALLALFGIAFVLWSNQQRDADRKAFERKTARQQVQLVVAQRTARSAQLKAEQARRLSDARFAFSFNKLACTLRKVSDQTITRLEATKPPKYKQAEVFWRNLRDSNVPIPDAPGVCESLPSKPPAVIQP